VNPLTFLPDANDPVLAEVLRVRAAVQNYYDKSLRQ
jgi:hypothetical protein